MQSKFLRKSSPRLMISAAMLLLCLERSSGVTGQEKATTATPAKGEAQNVPIEILDDPKTVDPAILMPAQLAVPFTVEFDGVPLKAVFTWLQQEQSINVLIDYKALARAKILDTDPVYEALNDAPLYLLLNRLETLGLGWFMQENSLMITSRDEYNKHDSTIAYNLGDLFDAGYSPQELLRTITRCSGGRWPAEGSGSDGGSALLLGDVVFVRQTDEIQREITGLLTAIRKHGRRTFTSDSPRHDALRTALDEKVTVDFQETPLIVAIQELSRQAQINIRLDRAALAKASIRERIPVSVKLADQKLSAVLRSLLSNLDLTWSLRDDVLWITTIEGASFFQKTAVFDVRDLCRDQDESTALKEAIQKQTRAKWRPQYDRGGFMETPLSGVLVVRHTENTLDEVLQLLENYRIALRGSKSRVVAVPELDPAEVIVGYYRLPGPLANDLLIRLPKLILPNTWQSEERPDAVGTIQEIPVDAKGSNLRSENLVLMIRQTRTAHQLIGKLIFRLVDSNSIDSNATTDTTQKPEKKTGTFGSRLIPAAAQ